MPTDEFEGAVSLRYGRYQRLEGEGYISGALSDNLRGRLAVQIKDYANDEGPWKNLYDGKRIGELEQTQIRGMLEWSNDTTTVLATLEMGEKEGDLTPYDNLFQSLPGAHPTAPDVPGFWNPAAVITDPHARTTYNADYSQTTDTEYTGARLRIEHDMDIGTFTSLTSFKDFERENREDSDNTPTRSVNIDWNSKLESFSQEFRLSGEKDNWIYLFGVYYEDDTTEIVELVDSRDFLGAYFGDDFEVETQSWAIFTNNEFRVTDRVAVVLGARYTEEDVDIEGAGYAAPPTATVGSFSTIATADWLAPIVVDDGRREAGIEC